MSEQNNMPLMTEREIELFGKYLSGIQYALEFGCGGSTKFFFDHGVEHLISVEGDKKWAGKVLLDPGIQEKKISKQFNILIPNIGPIDEKKFSYPIGNPTPQWMRYYSECFYEKNVKKTQFVLVDGRFRVACTLQSLIHLSPKTLILIHDFWDRPHYHDVLACCDIVDRKERSVVLQKKKRIKYAKIVDLLLSYVFDPR